MHSLHIGHCAVRLKATLRVKNSILGKEVKTVCDAKNAEDLLRLKRSGIISEDFAPQ